MTGGRDGINASVGLFVVDGFCTGFDGYSYGITVGINFS